VEWPKPEGPYPESGVVDGNVIVPCRQTTGEVPDSGTREMAVCPQWIRRRRSSERLQLLMHSGTAADQFDCVAVLRAMVVDSTNRIPASPLVEDA